MSRPSWGARLRAALAKRGVATTSASQNGSTLSIRGEGWRAELERPRGEAIVEVRFHRRGWHGQHTTIKGGRGVNDRAAKLLAGWVFESASASGRDSTVDRAALGGLLHELAVVLDIEGIPLSDAAVLREGLRVLYHLRDVGLLVHGEPCRDGQGRCPACGQ